MDSLRVSPLSSSASRRKAGAGRPGAVRLAFLLVVAAILPSCKSTPGDQPTLSAVTVRVSVQASGAEANAGVITTSTLANGVGSLNPSLSSDGRFVAFESTSTNLTPAFVNGFRNIFVKDRQDGSIVEITSVVSGEFGPFPDDCITPAISGNGEVVAFLSKGIYTSSLGGGTNVDVWVYNRVTQLFSCGTVSGITFPNADCSNLSLSDDGRFLCFTTAATNILKTALSAPAAYYANPSAGIQVYVTDLQAPNTVPAIQLMSPSTGSATTGATGSSGGAAISGDGTLVSFASTATNLIASPPTSGAYTSKVGSTSVALVSVGLNPGTMTIQPANGHCFGTAISTHGEFVAFSASGVSNWGPTVNLGVFRYDSIAGQAVVVAPDLQSKSGVILLPDQIGLSGDGQMLVYMTSQVTVRNLATGALQLASIDISGTGADFQCFSPAISEDGRWAAWYTLASNLVASDTNGSNDVFVRGPLR